MSRILILSGVAALLLTGVGVQLATADVPPPPTPNPLLGEDDPVLDTATPQLARIDPYSPWWAVGDPVTNAMLREEQLEPYLDEGLPPPLVMPP